MLAEILIPRRAISPGPTDNFWYEPVGRRTGSQQTVSDDSSLSYSGAWAARMKLAGVIASLPCKTYQQIDATRNERRDHPLWPILHDEPNSEEDSFTFWERIVDWWIKNSTWFDLCYRLWWKLV